MMDAIDRIREAARNEEACIELNRQNKELRDRLANWQDDINAVLKQRDDLHFRVARLEGVVRMLISCVEDASVLAFDDELESARCALEDECHESPA